MNKSKLLSLLFGLSILLILSQCKELGLSSLPAPVIKYFPSPGLLKDGVAQKYHFHYQRSEGSEIWTDIMYLTYQWNEQQELIITNYSTDFTPTRARRISFEEGAMQLLEDIVYSGQDTLQQSLLSTVMRNWKKDTATLKESSIMDNTLGYSTEMQLARKDTLVEERPAMVFSGKYNGASITDGDTSLYAHTFKEIYAEGLGLYAQSFQGEQYRGDLELIEQLPMSVFQQRMQHGIERIAFIDPDATLGYRPDFKLCTHTDEIIDYYNTDPDIHYMGGKYALWKVIQPQLQPTRYEGISGYMTFRFVINCNGETGRFTLEAADLDFQPAQFPETAISHLGNITANLTEWRPGVHKGEPADAYAYLTYKFKNGELVELLP